MAFQGLSLAGHFALRTGHACHSHEEYHFIQKWQYLLLHYYILDLIAIAYDNFKAKDRVWQELLTLFGRDEHRIANG